jgi:hypothetical protein
MIPINESHSWSSASATATTAVLPAPDGKPADDAGNPCHERQIVQRQ